jgi:Mrp family chromosome partitioning ATPase
MSERLLEAIERARREREGAIGLTQTPGNFSAANLEEVTEADFVNRPHVEESDKRPTGFPKPLGEILPAEESQVKINEKSATPSAGVRFHSTPRVQLSPGLLSDNKVIAGDITDPQVGAYRQLRSQVLDSMRRNNWRTLAVTSAQEGAGKTLTCVNLAICISQEANQTVMLVDLDLTKPDVANTLGIDVKKGIVDHLMHGEPIENILLNPEFPRLVVIPGTPQGRPVSEMLSSPQMKHFLTDITNRYSNRIIIFDLPPLLRNDDAMVFVPNADACLFVVEDGVTRPDEIEYCFQLLKHSKLIGTILNKAR